MYNLKYILFFCMFFNNNNFAIENKQAELRFIGSDSTQEHKVPAKYTDKKRALKTNRQALYNAQPVWSPDNRDGSYRNPIIHADYSDPDVIRVGSDYYMVSSSFSHFPGLPILHSTDLVNWKIIGHAVSKYPVDTFANVQHGNGIWAPSIRYHKGEFYIYFGDPDIGVFVTKAKKPSGPWSELYIVQKAKGWIDPCPLWDDDGNAYLVHAWAKSRSGRKHILTVHKMAQDGMSLLDSGVTVYNGEINNPTTEGPKFYKRNGFYYIFAPAGGVKPGWQIVLKSKSVFGPYEVKTVLEKGKGSINGPHQGGWVESENGESWFLHFQDKDAYGRIVHLQPVKWENDWPVIGFDFDKNGIGEPVLVWEKPFTKHRPKISVPETSDEFNNRSLGLQWQWQANWSNDWYSLTARKGFLRLYPVQHARNAKNLWHSPNILMQKIPAETIIVETFVDAGQLAEGGRAGLIVLGLDYVYFGIKRENGEFFIVQQTCTNADTGSPEQEKARENTGTSKVYLRMEMTSGAVCNFSYSTDGKEYLPLGVSFTSRAGKWVGAKVGLVYDTEKHAGFAEFDWFRFLNK